MTDDEERGAPRPGELKPGEQALAKGHAKESRQARRRTQDGGTLPAVADHACGLPPPRAA
jgi:hypothetical protein